MILLTLGLNFCLVGSLFWVAAMDLIPERQRQGLDTKKESIFSFFLFVLFCLNTYSLVTL